MPRLLAAVLTCMAAAALAVGAAFGIVAAAGRDTRAAEHAPRHLRDGPADSVPAAVADQQRGRTAMPVRSAWQDVPRLRVRSSPRSPWPRCPPSPRRSCARSAASTPACRSSSTTPASRWRSIGIRRAIEDFVQHLVAAEDRPHGRQPEVFQEFGRGEGLHGRSLDSLQAIYRLGVRLAWRRLAEIGQQVEIPPPAMYELVESGFEYLDGLVDTVRTRLRRGRRPPGRRTAAAAAAADRTCCSAEHRTGDPADALAERAARIGWPLPEQVAVGVLLRPARGGRGPRRGPGRAAGHGVRAAAHGRPRAGRGRPARNSCTAR